MSAFYTPKGNQATVQDKINELSTMQGAFGWIPFVGQVLLAGTQISKGHYQDYLEDIDLLQSYNDSLLEIQGNKIAAQNSAFEYESRIDDLNRDKIESEEFLEDYRQMLEGEGDDDNLLLQQDRINQANITNAENDLAAYRDSSALELDSLIRQGFNQYTDQRDNQAIENIYASATGSIVGAFNSAARRVRNSIRAFVGDDMRFNEEPEGTSVIRSSGDAMIGSYAKMMLSNRTIIRNNKAKLQTEIDTARFAYDSFRDQAEDAAEENEQFLEDYDKTLANYSANLSWAQSMVQHYQQAAEQTLKDASAVLEDVNEFEKKIGLELTTFS